MRYNKKRVLSFLDNTDVCRETQGRIIMWVSRLIKLFPRKTIQIGKTTEELDGLSEEYFKELPNEVTKIIVTEDCDYPVLEREILPEKILCPNCGGITLEGLDYCDKCGADLNLFRSMSET